ncbi:MAG: MlaD family protein [Actinomycetota bacterium]|nr:MlaD family protein [Actinomycetota bacterium]
MKRSRPPAFASPVLIGAVTVLAMLVAVFLAYNANQGLPFVPTRTLTVDIANASNLVVGNDVREGGFRIGLVSGMRPVALPNGQVGAQLTLQLNQSDGAVPTDSTVSIRPLSVLGLKYVDLHKGISRLDFAEGGTVPLGQTTVPVQLDQIFSTFNPPTRTAVQNSLVGIGDTLAGRGSDLNDTIALLPKLFGHLAPVAHDLSQPSTGLSRFLVSLNGFMGAVAPVAQVNARLFGVAAATFEAISRDPNALESTIAQSPSTLSVSTRSLAKQQPLLSDLTILGQQLTPATASLNAALPQLNPAIEAGTRTLVRTPVLNANLQQVLNALKQLARAPGTNIAVNALTSTVDTLNPMVRYLGPVQTVCNGWNYWWTFLSEHLSAHTNFGFAQRALLNTDPYAAPPYSEKYTVSQAGASAPAGSAGGPEYLHAQFYGAAIDNLGNADCEAGQRGWPKKLNFFDPLGRLLAIDPHTPGNQGPTFNGRAHVPIGETFSRSPLTGPQTAYTPGNP